MKNLVLVSLSLSYLLGCCSNPDNIKLGQDPMIHKVFSPNEIQSLEKTLALYQQKILTEYPEENDFILAFQKHLNHLCSFKNVGEALQQDDISEDNYQEIYDVMFESGLYDLFYPADTIFVDPISGSKSNFRKSDSIFRISHTIERFGKYAEFLKELSTIDTIYEYHHNTLMSAGGIPPSYIAMMLCKNERYELNEPKVQLFYLITLLDPL